MHKKHIFLRVFQKIALFACVFCAFFISPVFATLPAGYTELEYIETTAGTEYIDPQVTGNARWVITAQTNAIKGSSQSLITSTDPASGGTWYGEFTTTRHWDIVSGGTNIAPTTKTTADLTFDSNGATGTIGGVSVTRSIACTQGNWRIFGTVSGIGPYVGKLFDAKVYQNNTLVRNFIPAKRISDNVVGMYDTVSGTFFTNQGTGSFIAGPVADIKIATTKMVDEEFKAAEAKLATTVQTIESVVSRTIAQTGQIQVLQDTKQTRPDETCPANMKCLLVQDEDGTPHWYPIIEP